VNFCFLLLGRMGASAVSVVTSGCEKGKKACNSA